MQRRRSLSLFLGAVLTLGLILTLDSDPAIAGSGDALSRALKFPKASLLVTERGRPVISRYPGRAMVPASTMKILTALAAIERWGDETKAGREQVRIGIDDPE